MTASAVTEDGRARVLADGNQMPMLGLGVWQVPNGPASVNAVRYLSDATVNRVAQRAGRTPAQVLLRWCLQHGISC
jgi:diketogulonate reductase-like aldo/keto reductase